MKIFLIILFLLSSVLYSSDKIYQTQKKLNQTKQAITEKKKEKQIYIDRQKVLQEDLKKIENQLKIINMEKKEIENKIYQTKISISALETNLKILSSDMDFYVRMLTAGIKSYVEREYLINNFFENNFEKRLKKDILKEFSKQIIRIKETLNYTEELKEEYEKEKIRFNMLNAQLENKKQQQISLYKMKGELLNELKLKQKQIDREISELNKTQKELELVLKKLYKEEKSAKLKKLQFQEKKIAKVEKKFIKPLDGAVICKFGKTQLMKDGYCVLRNGVIIQGMSNGEVVCVEDGKVLFVSNNFRSYGKIVIVEHPNNIHTIYGNLGEITVTEGSLVKKATSIGKADSSGQIYFEIRKDLIPLDPELYFIE